jgi:hypothetical protein
MFSVCGYVNALCSSNYTRLNLKRRKFRTVCFANDGTVSLVALFVSSSIQLCAFEYLRCNTGVWNWDVKCVLLLYLENEDKWVLLKGVATAAYCRDRIESSGKWEGKARWSINQFIDTNDCGFKVGASEGLWSDHIGAPRSSVAARITQSNHRLISWTCEHSLRPLFDFSPPQHPQRIYVCDSF